MNKKETCEDLVKKTLAMNSQCIENMQAIIKKKNQAPVDISKVTEQEIDSIVLPEAVYKQVVEQFNIALATEYGCKSVISDPSVLLKQLIRARKLITLEVLSSQKRSS